MYIPQKIKLFTLCPSYTALLNLTVHAHCTGPLELVPKFYLFFYGPKSVRHIRLRTRHYKSWNLKNRPSVPE